MHSYQRVRGLTRSSLSENETLLIGGFRRLDELGRGRLLERLELLLQNK